jgi:hypothetical protein
MGQMASAALSGWGVAAALFLLAAIGATIALRGQARAFGASLAAIVAVMLLGVGYALAPPGGDDITPERALAGLETNQANIPRTDRDVAAALLTQAARETNTGNTDGARKTYDRAKQLYRAAHDVLGEASAVLGEARLQHMIGQSARARVAYNEAVKLFQQGGSAAGQARAYASMGDLEKDTFQWAKASEYYLLARQAWQKAPEPKSDPHVLLGIEDAPLLRDGEAKARAALMQARKIYDQLSDKSGLADLQTIEAQLELNLGRAGLARAKLGEARTLYAVAGNAAKQGDAALAMAHIDLAQGYNRQARSTLDLTLADFAQAGDATGTARTRIAEGDLERMQGRLQKAKELYAGAAGTLEGIGHRSAAEALRKLGEVQSTLGEAPAAKVTLNKAITTAQRWSAPDEEARSQLSAAAQARAAGEPDSADKHAAAAATLFDRQGNKAGRARAALSRAADPDAYADAAKRLEAAQLPLGVVLADLGRGDSWRARGNAAEAGMAYQEAARTWAAIEAKTREANKMLGLPAIDGFQVVAAATPTETAIDELAQAGEPDPVLVRANLDDFPDHNIEARKLVEQVNARLTAALDSARTR